MSPLSWSGGRPPVNELYGPTANMLYPLLRGLQWEVAESVSDFCTIQHFCQLAHGAVGLIQARSNTKMKGHSFKLYPAPQSAERGCVRIFNHVLKI